MKITIYGAGYIGLITGACLAQVGNDVLCIDSKEIINNIINGEIPIYEPGLNTLIANNIATGHFNLSTSHQKGVEHGLYQFIATETPIRSDKSTDLKSVFETAHHIATHMNGYKIIVDKSTVPVGTADKVKKTIQKELDLLEKKHEFDMVSNPEFLKEGNAIEEFMKPDRIIVGTENPRTTELMRELFSPFNHSRDRFVSMSIRSAELTKFSTTALLATKISFMNELANIAEKLDADIEEVRLGIGSDPRIGYHFIYPSCGYGGSFFPRDTQTLIKMATDKQYTPQLLNAVESVNTKQKMRPFLKLQQYYGESLKNKTIALWGLSFKPDTDNMQDASSCVLMETLWQIGAKVQAHDPVANNECIRIYGERNDLRTFKTKENALIDADALVIITDWQEFRSPDFDLIKKTLNDPVIVDGRNLYNPTLLKEMGFCYYGIGRGEK